MIDNDQLLESSPLGKTQTYIDHYQPDLLFPISRHQKREAIGINIKLGLPFQGRDIWNAYELSWLNAKGKPIVAYGEFYIPCESPQLIESKSFKLYLNSFNQTVFRSFAEVENVLIEDLSKATGALISVKLLPIWEMKKNIAVLFEGESLDKLDIDCDTYLPFPQYLQTDHQIVTETLYSDLLKSNCLVTGQPDWGSIQVSYTGRKIQREGLLKYIISFRKHNEFHEQCVERIFMDIMKYCAPEKCVVYARYTRRGGLDINPYRANYPIEINNERLFRQ